MYGLGVDLGTTWTAAAVWSQGRAETVALGQRALAVPSVVLAENGGYVTGEPAQQRSASAVGLVAREFKRRFGDEVGFRLGDQQVRADALTAALLADVVATVTQRQGGRPAALALTLPATWQGYRRDLLLEVAARVLPDVPVVTVAEPAAAAIHHAARRQLSPGATLGVYDLGGGTFDATVLRKTATGFELLGTPVGSDALGGCDVDQLLLRRVLSAVDGAAGLARSGDPQVRAGMAVLREHVVAAKEALSATASTVVPVVLPGLVTEVAVTRRELEGDVRELVEATLDVFADAVAGCDLEPRDLDGVLLVGGASRMPVVARALRSRFGLEPVLDEHPKFAVCLGAAISAGAVADRSPAPGAAAGLPPVTRPVAPRPPVVTRPVVAPPVATPPVATQPAAASEAVTAEFPVVEPVVEPVEPAVEPQPEPEPEPTAPTLRLPWDPEPEDVPPLRLPWQQDQPDADGAAHPPAAGPAAPVERLRLPWDDDVPSAPAPDLWWAPQAAFVEPDPALAAILAESQPDSPAAEAAIGLIPEQVAVPAGIALAVDLVSAGLQGADEVPLRPVVSAPRRVSMRPAQTVDIEVGGEDDDYRRQGLRSAALVVLAVVGLLAAVITATTLLR